MNGSGTWMIYGANGYTGEICAEEAVRRGERPILAGRNEAAVRALADRLQLPWRAFPLERDRIDLTGVRAVLHCAGPFSRTSAPMRAACLAARAHYLDVTGEISVFEACLAEDDAAKQAGIVILPGAGFDVVPSDCLAASLKAALPTAHRLELAFAGEGGPSRGTAKTSFEGLLAGNFIREEGEIVRVPHAYKTKVVRFRDKQRHCVCIPWGDVSTAYHSTGIPNIIVYMATPRTAAWGLRAAGPLLGVLELAPVRRFIEGRLDRIKGQPADVRATLRSHLWGQVTDPEGRSATGTVETTAGYLLTAQTAVEATLRILAGKVAAGSFTPSRAFGAGFIDEIPGCSTEVKLD